MVQAPCWVYASQGRFVGLKHGTGSALGLRESRKICRFEARYRLRAGFTWVKEDLWVWSTVQAPCWVYVSQGRFLGLKHGTGSTLDLRESRKICGFEARYRLRTGFTWVKEDLWVWSTVQAPCWVYVSQGRFLGLKHGTGSALGLRESRKICGFEARYRLRAEV